MPIREYTCRSCHNTIEIIEGVEPVPAECPFCMMRNTLRLVPISRGAGRYRFADEREGSDE